MSYSQQTSLLRVQLQVLELQLKGWGGEDPDWVNRGKDGRFASGGGGSDSPTPDASETEANIVANENKKFQAKLKQIAEIAAGVGIAGLATVVLKKRGTIQTFENAVRYVAHASEEFAETVKGIKSTGNSAVLADVGSRGAEARDYMRESKKYLERQLDELEFMIKHHKDLAKKVGKPEWQAEKRAQSQKILDGLKERHKELLERFESTLSNDTLDELDEMSDAINQSVKELRIFTVEAAVTAAAYGTALGVSTHLIQEGVAGGRRKEQVSAAGWDGNGDPTWVVRDKLGKFAKRAGEVTLITPLAKATEKNLEKIGKGTQKAGKALAHAGGLDKLAKKIGKVLPDVPGAREVLDYAKAHPMQTAIVLGMLAAATPKAYRKVIDFPLEELNKGALKEATFGMEKAAWHKHEAFKGLSAETVESIQSFDAKHSLAARENIRRGHANGTVFADHAGERFRVKSDMVSAVKQATYQAKNGKNGFFSIHNHPPLIGSKGQALVGHSPPGPEDIRAAAAVGEAVSVVSTPKYLYVMRSKDGVTPMDQEGLMRIAEAYSRSIQDVVKQNALKDLMNVGKKAGEKGIGDISTTMGDTLVGHVDSFFKMAKEAGHDVEFHIVPKYQPIDHTKRIKESYESFQEAARKIAEQVRRS